ncbi:hypothetical protein RFI_15969 [Reticulomyxa filosa]|uniref:Uncharacterized protein n=1 Tax=Reticulomyxa filosa TaxID=46433 RepID=X6N5M8_RETFI|nr:hypothetical protein RFI_15969 [Reticulomyxa filosa]|eukprot:ETO21238.1 hypothetical protein RFI_15969 [Reticulomyxa filosa]
MEEQGSEAGNVSKNLKRPLSEIETDDEEGLSPEKKKRKVEKSEPSQATTESVHADVAGEVLSTIEANSSSLKHVKSSDDLQDTNLAGSAPGAEASSSRPSQQQDRSKTKRTQVSQYTTQEEWQIPLWQPVYSQAYVPPAFVIQPPIQPLFGNPPFLSQLPLQPQVPFPTATVLPQQYSQRYSQQYPQQYPQLYHQYLQQIPQQIPQPVPQQIPQQVPQQIFQQVPQQILQQVPQQIPQQVQYSQPIPVAHVPPQSHVEQERPKKPVSRHTIIMQELRRQTSCCCCCSYLTVLSFSIRKFFCFCPSQTNTYFGCLFFVLFVTGLLGLLLVLEIFIHLVALSTCLFFEQYWHFILWLASFYYGFKAAYWLEEKYLVTYSTFMMGWSIFYMLLARQMPSLFLVVIKQRYIYSVLQNIIGVVQKG